MLKRVLLCLFLLMPPLSAACIAQDEVPYEEQRYMVDDFFRSFGRDFYDSTMTTAKCYAIMRVKGLTGCDKYAEMYVEKKEQDEMDEFLTASFSGIGVMLKAHPADTTKLMGIPLTGSPADKAGFLGGDILLRVDSTDVEGMRSDSVVTFIRGRTGTPVRITVRRGNSTVVLNIVRGTIHNSTVASTLTPEGIGYIRIAQFSDISVTGREFSQHMNALHAAGAVKIILDLRDNPGGSLETVLDILERHFSPRAGITMIAQRYRSGEISRFNTESASARKARLIVLTNRGTASASEILAGTLKEWKLATVVGDTTYGKGVVQSIYKRTSRGGWMFMYKFTTAEYLVGPNLRKINGIGVLPDIFVADSVYNGARPPIPERLDPAKATLFPEWDSKLRKAIELLKGN